MNSSVASASDPSSAPLAPVAVRQFADDLSLAEILAAESPPAAQEPSPRDVALPRRLRRRRRHPRPVSLRSLAHPAAHVPQEIAVAKRVRRGDEEAMQELVQAQPALRHLGRQEVPEPRHAAHRPDRRGQRRPDDRRPEVRSRAGRQVHLLRRLVDPPVDPRLARPPGPHRPRAAQPHRRPVAHHPHRRNAAPGAAARADARGTRQARPASPSTWCSRSPRSTPPRCASTRRSIPTATAR